MASGGKIKIKGGQRLARYLTNLQRNRDKLRHTKVEIGFFGPRIATLAALHELGSRPKDGTPVPARPAFGAAKRDVGQGFGEALRGAVQGERGAISRDAVEVAALAGLEAVRKSYLNAPGPPLSERQQQRKRGTPGEGRKLVGVKGPKLIEHLEARIDGQKVGK